MAADLSDVTPAEIEAAIDLLCSRGWSPPNAHGFATDIRDAIIAARRRAPPPAAPAPSAMATGEADLRAWLVTCAETSEATYRAKSNGDDYDQDVAPAFAARARAYREVIARIDATPPVAPAAVTEQQMDAAQAEWKRAVYDEPPADGDVHRQAWKRAVRAALAAAASAK